MEYDEIEYWLLILENAIFSWQLFAKYMYTITIFC